MIHEELEFRISQYADGTLPADEVAALQATLASDAEARDVLASYRKLDAALKRELPLPAMDFERLAEHLSDAVAESDRPVTIKLFTWTRAAGIAVAAMLVIAIGSVIFNQSRPRPQVHEEVAIVIPPTPPAPPAVVEVAGPMIELAAQPVVEEIAIGPSPALEQRTMTFAAAEDIIYRVPRVVIASTQIERQDTASILPF